MNSSRKRRRIKPGSPAIQESAGDSPAPAGRSKRAELVWALIVFAFSFAIGDWFSTHWGGRAHFYQSFFAPAMSVACGHGFTDRRGDSLPFTHFLLGVQDNFTCADLERDTQAWPLNVLQKSIRYLLISVGFVWRLRGISWSVLGPLYGFLFAVLVISAYGIFRISVRRPIAVVLAALFATSPSHLINLPHLRDYGKAPFIVLLTFLLALVVTLPVTTKRLLLLAALYGAIVGIGVGFRVDVEIMLPPFVGVIALFLPLRPLERWPLRIGAIALFVAAFLAAGWPVLANQGSRGGWFVADHGLMEPFDEIFEVGNETYGRGHMYHDTFIGIELQEFSRRAQGNKELAMIGSLALEKASFGYFLKTAEMFPADILLRAYASSLKVLDLPFQPATFRYSIAWQFGRPEDVRVDSKIVSVACAIRERVLTLFHGTGFWFVLTAVFLLRKRPRVAIFAALGILYLTTYPFLQIDPRHYFHLEFVGLWAAGVTVEGLIRWRSHAPPRDIARDAAIYASIFALIILVPLTISRWVQTKTLRTLFSRYESENATRMPLTPRELPNGRVIFPPQWPGNNYFHFLPASEKMEGGAMFSSIVGSRPEDLYHSELLRVTLDTRTLLDPFVTLTTRYTARDERAARVGYDPTLRIEVPLRAVGNDHIVRVVIPVHEVTGYSRFDGIELNAAEAKAVLAIERLDRPLDFPLMVRAVLGPGWRDSQLFQRLRYWSPNPISTIAGNLVRPRTILNKSLNGWLLLGYDVDETLAAGASPVMRLHWRAPRGVRVTEAPNLKRAGGSHWIQTVPSVRNIIPDGSFNRDASSQSFPVDIYEGENEWPKLKDGGHTRSHVDDKSGFALSLIHDAYLQRSSYVTSIIEVQDDHFYLQATDLRCTTCSVTIGSQWMQNGYVSHVNPLANPSAWARYAAVARPPAGSSGVQLWMLNGHALGQADFDNVVFADLGRVVRSPDGSLPPIELASPDARPPQFAVRQFFGGWELRGYDLDSRALISGKPVAATLHWQAPVGVAPTATPSLRPCGPRCWLQTIRGVTSAIPNGGFETNDSSFFPGNLYAPAPVGARVEPGPAGAGFIELGNTPDTRRTSLVSRSIPVVSDRVYLQSAILTGTPQARIYYGRSLLPMQSSNYVWGARGAAPEERLPVHEMFIPAPGTTHVEVWMLNLDADGPGRLTDLVFAEIGRLEPCSKSVDKCGPPIAPAVSDAELALAAPQFPMTFEINGWQLLGYDRSPTEFVLHWRAPGSAEQQFTDVPDGADHVDGTSRWFQKIVASSMIRESAFDAGDGPSLFPGDIYSAPASSRVFSSVEGTAGTRRTAAVLRNDATSSRSSFVSLALPASPNHLFLQTGAIRAPSGDAYLGRQWLPGGEVAYAASAARTPDWKTFRQVIASPKSATSVSVWLLNLAAGTEVQFADVSLDDLGSLNVKPGSFPLKPNDGHLMPERWLAQEVNGWTIAGFSERPLRIFWLPPPGAVLSGRALTRAAGGLFVQSFGSLPNLIAGGDFEANDWSAFPDDIYGSAAATRSFAEAGAPRRRVATLRNSRTTRRSSLVSIPIAIREGDLYLQSGFLQSIDGSAYAGRQWQPGGASSYAMSGASGVAWSRYGQVVVPPSGSSHVLVWLLNVDSDGTAQFDDATLRHLGALDRNACRKDGSRTVCSAPLSVKNAP